MTAISEKFIGNEARWLIREIGLLAVDAGFTPEQVKETCLVAGTLADAVFSRKETCLPINDAATRTFLHELSGKTNPIISRDSTSSTPLVFDSETEPKKPALYFKKHYDEEILIARKVYASAKTPRRELSDAQEKIIAAGTKDGFGFALSQEQKQAVRMILQRQFSIVSGGPGTGKTSLLLRALIGILTEQPEAIVEIAAPTGKAAARIRESISKQISEINTGKAGTLADKNLCGKILKIAPKTLHRLLSISPDHPLPKAISADVVIIDEASMVSQSLMAALLSSMPPNAKLVLLGDKNQLDSVQPGRVFGDFYSAPALASSRAELVESHRFRNDKFIGKFADAILAGAGNAALDILAEAPPENTIIELCRENNSREQIECILQATLPDILKNPSADADPKPLLLALESSRVLTPTSEGPFGKNTLNTVARKIFAPTASGEHFHGRPILITQNSSEFSLSNGDIGIILRSPENQKFYAYFLDENGEVRRIPTAFLPEHETAYAMTVHKSQGSEFSRLSIFFPKNTHVGFYTRQLLYTAITRFKETPQSRFCFCYDAESVVAAVSNASQAFSLIPERLK